jgi:hypothetical protein
LPIGQTTLESNDDYWAVTQPSLETENPSSDTASIAFAGEYQSSLFVTKPLELSPASCIPAAPENEPNLFDQFSMTAPKAVETWKLSHQSLGSTNYKVAVPGASKSPLVVVADDFTVTMPSEGMSSEELLNQWIDEFLYDFDDHDGGEDYMIFV